MSAVVKKFKTPTAIFKSPDGDTDWVSPPQDERKSESDSRDDLRLFDFLRQFAKFLSLFMTGLYLEMCQLLSFSIGQKRYQSFQFSGRFMRTFGFSNHDMFEFPD